MNLKEMSEKIIKEAQKPLSPVEIWEIAEPQGYKEKLSLKGKTIPSTIGAQIYTDIKDNPDTVFIKVNTKPVKFYLKGLPQDFDVNLLGVQPVQKIKTNKSYFERELHALLSFYVYTYHSIYIVVVLNKT
jgi:hypothetical protein